MVATTTFVPSPEAQAQDGWLKNQKFSNLLERNDTTRAEHTAAGAAQQSRLPVLEATHTESGWDYLIRFLEHDTGIRIILPYIIISPPNYRIF